ncbi:hypothetical protein PVAG01_02017 [Phlyctema vagabunda]|uniref:Uncharacterized protein n=1 Tax=Phlyctema vagabunda TaxID=108571 RepID=A0ABR4PYT0_9HELO
MRRSNLWAVLALGAIGARAESGHSPMPLPSYHYGAKIPVSCLNRSIDTGEHIQDEKNELQYIPFPVCNETGKPLELLYGVEEGIQSPYHISSHGAVNTPLIRKLHRTQLHDSLHHRSLLPSARILHPQRRTPHLPSTFPTSTRYNHCTRRALHARVYPSYLRAGRHPTALAPPHLHPPQHSPALDAETPPAPTRLGGARLGRRLLDLAALAHDGPRGADEEAGHRRPPPAQLQRALVPDALAADDQRQGRVGRHGRPRLRIDAVLLPRQLRRRRRRLHRLVLGRRPAEARQGPWVGWCDAAGLWHAGRGQREIG